MRQVSVGRRLLAAVFGFVLAIALSIYNAVNTTDTYTVSYTHLTLPTNREV